MSYTIKVLLALIIIAIFVISSVQVKNEQAKFMNEGSRFTQEEADPLIANDIVQDARLHNIEFRIEKLEEHLRKSP
jgi:uncharacterized membrane protein YcaP (DUF421 family)